jgi:putative PEP-CTERM system histidine kinase
LVSGVSALLSFWSHALAALMFAALLIWQLREGVRAPVQRVLLAGLLLTAAWGWLNAIAPQGLLAGHAETARNLVWVGLLYALAAMRQEEGRQLRGVRLVYAAVSAILALQFILDLLPVLRSTPASGADLGQMAVVLRMTVAAGALVLVHNLYGQAAPSSRSSIRLVMLALALTWVYDLNLYTLDYVDPGLSRYLFDARGAFVAATAALFALGMGQKDGWRFSLSRAATFQSLSLLAICSYFVVMAVLATVLENSSWQWTRGLAVLALAAMTVAAVVLLPSPKARAWLKVKAAKHLFEHRYDYRTEWLRFAETLGRSGSDAPLAERVVKALADIVDAPAGLLLSTDESGFAIEASWNWPDRLPPLGSRREIEALWRGLAPEGRIVEFDPVRAGIGERDSAVPGAMLEEERLWAGVPLIHHERAIGLVLLAAPDHRRPLDWEDFDLLRTAGRQAASSLAEAHGQQALMNAQRFEEFNRRFAFILHDIKNLVSQLSLLTRNAERHADNPEFRADMVATLKGSVGKMNELLTRLAPKGGAAGVPGSGVFSLRSLLTSVVAAKKGGREVRLLGPTGLMVRGDAAGLEQAVSHLIQNALDASPPDQPVTVRVSASGERVAVDVIDKGCGMDAEFVRSRLFQPFASTKESGFGIGAYEARALILAMGGELSVTSHLGAGTRFSILLPAAGAAPESMTA